MFTILTASVTEIHLVQSDVYEFTAAIGFARLIFTFTVIDCRPVLLLWND